MSRNRTGLIFAFALLAPSAMAASLPGPKAPPPSPYTAPAAAFSWTGLYAGVQAGGVWLSDKGKAVDKFGGAPVGTAAAKGSSFSGGLLAGYNWQYNNLVMGVEGDVEASSARAKASTFQSVFLGPVAADTATARFASPWRGSLRLRAGFAVRRGQGLRRVLLCARRCGLRNRRSS